MNTSRQLDPFTGIYEVSEAARYIRATIRVPTERTYLVNNRHLVRWIRHGLALPSLAEVPGRELVIAFEDLISMRVIALLRAVGISWTKIHTAEQWLREVTGATRPFATELVWTESCNIFADRQGQLIAASLGGQYAFQELFRAYLWPISGLDFDEHRVANAWRPHDGVLLKASIQFGEPCIIGTRIPTSTVWAMHKGGDTQEFIAKVYDLPLERVSQAIDWEESLGAA